MAPDRRASTPPGVPGGAGPSYPVRVNQQPGQPHPQHPQGPPQDPYAPQPPYGQYAHPAPTGYAPGPYAPPPYAPGPYGPPAPVSSVRPDAEFHELTRGPRRAWWRPVVALLLWIPVGIVVALVAIVAMLAPMLSIESQRQGFEQGGDGMPEVFHPLTFLGMNAGLAVLVPAAVGVLALAYWMRPGFASSVAGRFRWGWALRVLVVLTPWWVLYLLGTAALAGESFTPHPHRYFWWMLLVVVLTTPLQAAGEEYLFRGFVMQWFGSWIPWTWLALGLSTVTSVSLFALAHGSLDPWVLADLGLFALVALVMIVRTGGMEAAVVMHSVNNVTLMVISLFFGGFEDGFVGGDTTSTPAVLLMSVLLQGVGLALVEWQWRRSGLGNRTAADPQELLHPRDRVGAAAR